MPVPTCTTSRFRRGERRVAIAASGLALWLAGGRQRPAAADPFGRALGFAISGMHYTAMAGLTLMPHARPRRRAGAFHATSSRSSSRSWPSAFRGLPADAGAGPRAQQGGAERATLLADDARVAEPRATPVDGPIAHPTSAAAALGPLGGAGGPPRRFAAVCRSSTTARPISSRSRHRRRPRQRALHLPLRRQREVVLPAGDRRRRIAARPQPVSSACIAATSSTSSAWWG